MYVSVQIIAGEKVSHMARTLGPHIRLR